MPYCAVLECKNDSRTKNLANGGISYHRFPQDPHLKEKWMDATGRQNWMPTKLSTICSQHFDQKYLILKQSGYRYLSDKAVPTLNFVRFFVENEAAVKDEPSSDSDSNEESTSQIPDMNFEVNIEPNTSNELTYTFTEPRNNNKYDSSQNDTVQEQKLKSMLRGKDEKIKKHRLKIKQLQSKLRRLSKKFEIVQGELMQRKMEDDQMGITREKYVHKEPEDGAKLKRREEFEFVRV